MKAACAALLFLLVSLPALAAPESFSNPAMEQRARHLQRELRCLVCQGESLDESSAPLAADLRRLVRAHMAAGESDAQIKTFLVARYGNFILMDPPFEADTYALWLTPFVVLMAGGGVAFWVVRRARRSASRSKAMIISDC
jgi:cytochrome c-type biogenesis protein CcmH